ncbi:MAG TPA: hemerythrin domain-containing protein [Pseudonocardiaceae bacterium]|nr:hemerythrin domain-containing protein [Pseudonocardiaceae bacterium]
MAGETTETHPAGEHLVAELLWVHKLLRADIATLHGIAADITTGASGTDVTTALGELRARSPLWGLRINCLRYCRFVHAHHGAEDAMLFPRLRATNPALGPTVDRLEADHRKVSDLLDRVEELANGLETGTDEHRPELVTALAELSTHLLAHLDFEEESITPTLRRWQTGLW